MPKGTDSLDSSDFRFADLDAHFPDVQPLMLVTSTEGRPVGGALAFRSDHDVVVLRLIAVIEAFRHRGIGRRIVERVESEARILGAERICLGTDEAVGFWFHLGYTPNLLFQWVYDRAAHEQESELLLAGALSGTRRLPSEAPACPGGRACQARPVPSTTRRGNWGTVDSLHHSPVRISGSGALEAW